MKSLAQWTRAFNFSHNQRYYGQNVCILKEICFYLINDILGFSLFLWSIGRLIRVTYLNMFLNVPGNLGSRQHEAPKWPNQPDLLIPRDMWTLGKFNKGDAFWAHLCMVGSYASPSVRLCQNTRKKVTSKKFISQEPFERSGSKVKVTIYVKEKYSGKRSLLM